MSLNRWEQALLDYLNGQPDEERHWRRRFLEISGSEDSVREVERELWEYLVERCRHTQPFCHFEGAPHPSRTSMRNLAELLVRLWSRSAAVPPQQRFKP